MAQKLKSLFLFRYNLLKFNKQEILYSQYNFHATKYQFFLLLLAGICSVISTIGSWARNNKYFDTSIASSSSFTLCWNSKYESCNSSYWEGCYFMLFQLLSKLHIHPSFFSRIFELRNQIVIYLVLQCHGYYLVWQHLI